MNFLLSKYNFVRVAAVSPEVKIADVKFNLQSILNSSKNLNEEGCQIAVFPELCLTSYSCADLFFQNSLQQSVIEGLIEFAEKSINFDIVSIVGLPLLVDNRLFNCAAVVYNGEILGIVPKTFLCNSKEYYEKRWFTSSANSTSDFVEINSQKIPFSPKLIFQIKSNINFKFAIEICEDLWSPNSPSTQHAMQGANLIFNLSASNDYVGKANYRNDLIRIQSAKLNCAYIYTSAGASESSSDLTYSGNIIIAENGAVLENHRNYSFQSDECICDIDLDILNSSRMKNSSYMDDNTINSNSQKYKVIEINFQEKQVKNIIRKISKRPFVPTNSNDSYIVCDDIFQLQATALARRLKQINCDKLVLGLSGGLDSTLALLAAIEAFKKLTYDVSGIYAITMPGFGTSNRTKKNSIELAVKLGVRLREISIEASVLQHFDDISHDANDFSVVYENAQARERTQILMDFANKIDAIVLGTGDLSELALGWCTYNADQMSMYGINSGIPKTLIKHLIKWYADEKANPELANVLNDIIATPISPELLPLDKNNSILQKTEDSIGKYDLHDFFLYNFLRNGFSASKILKLAILAFNKNEFENRIPQNEILETLKVFYKRFFTNQFKRNPMPDGVKVGSIALSPRSDWRMPSDAEYKIWLDELNSINLEEL